MLRQKMMIRPESGIVFIQPGRQTAAFFLAFLSRARNAIPIVREPQRESRAFCLPLNKVPEKFDFYPDSAIAFGSQFGVKP
jgi:hypothetical protein